MISLSHYLFLSAFLFALGVTGVMVRRNAIILLMSVELMLNAGNLAIIAFARYRTALPSFDSENGMILVFMVMAVAAAEVGVGLAILINLYRQRRTVDVDDLHLLRG